MFDRRQTVNNYSYATEQKPSIACAIDIRYSGIFLVNKNINKIDRKKVDKFLQNNKVSSEDAACHY